MVAPLAFCARRIAGWLPFLLHAQKYPVQTTLGDNRSRSFLDPKEELEEIHHPCC